jgi:hypothetical protein
VWSEIQASVVYTACVRSRYPTILAGSRLCHATRWLVAQSRLDSLGALFPSQWPWLDEISTEQTMLFERREGECRYRLVRRRCDGRRVGQVIRSDRKCLRYKPSGSAVQNVAYRLPATVSLGCNLLIVQNRVPRASFLLLIAVPRKPLMADKMMPGESRWV